ncbi:MAG: hypothetical protein WCI02_06250 [Planctomycetota bacterium]
MNRLNTRASGSGNPSAPEGQIEGLPESPETYWRWGLPSLVLAIITISLVLVSQFYTRPRILARYQRIVQRAMEGESTLGHWPSVSAAPSEFRTSRDRPNDHAIRGSEASLLREIGELRNAELASQRLVVEQPSNSDHRYAAARIALMLSKSYWNLSRLLSKADDETRMLTIEQSAMAARDRAEDAMRSALRYPGSGHLLAEKWTLTEQLNRMSLFTKGSVATIESMIRQVEGLCLQNPNDPEWFQLLGRSRVMLALNPMSEASKNQRIALIEQAERAFKKSVETDVGVSEERDRDDFGKQIWMAEAMAAMDAEQSSHLARESVLQRTPPDSANGLGVSESVEDIDALFRALLLMGSPEEALKVFESRLDQFNVPERAVLQSLVASSSVRAAVLQTLIAKEKDRGLSGSRLARLVMRLAPLSSDARALLEAFVLETPVAGEIFALGGDAGEGEDESLAIVFRWLRRERQMDKSEDSPLPSEIFPKDWASRPTDSNVLVGMVPLIFEWVGRNQISPRRGLELVDAMQLAIPENVDIVYARAMLAIQTRNYDRAIVDLRNLLDKIPGNSQLENLLLAAYEKAIQANSQMSKEDVP